MTKYFKTISITSYLLIFLSGQIIALPFFFWLFFTCFDFGNPDQILAILGVIGLALNFTKWKNILWINILSFLLMITPLIGRMLQVPIKLFDYLGFEIPFALFIICYLIYIGLNFRKHYQRKNI